MGYIDNLNNFTPIDKLMIYAFFILQTITNATFLLILYFVRIFSLMQCYELIEEMN